MYQLSEGLKIRKILADGIWMQKNRQTRGNIFWILIELCGFKANLHTAWKVQQWLRQAPKLSIPEVGTCKYPAEKLFRKLCKNPLENINEEVQFCTWHS